MMALHIAITAIASFGIGASVANDDSNNAAVYGVLLCLGVVALLW